MSPPPRPAESLPQVRSAQTLRKLLARFLPVKFAAAGALFLYLLRTACDLSVSWLIGLAIGMLANSVGRGGPLHDEFVQALWLLGAVATARLVLLYLATFSAAAVSQTIENSLRSELFAKVTSLRFTDHDENRSGKTIARSLRDM